MVSTCVAAPGSPSSVGTMDRPVWRVMGAMILLVEDEHSIGKLVQDYLGNRLDIAQRATRCLFLSDEEHVRVPH